MHGLVCAFASVAVGMYMCSLSGARGCSDPVCGLEATESSNTVDGGLQRLRARCQGNVCVL